MLKSISYILYHIIWQMTAAKKMTWQTLMIHTWNSGGGRNEFEETVHEKRKAIVFYLVHYLWRCRNLCLCTPPPHASSFAIWGDPSRPPQASHHNGCRSKLRRRSLQWHAVCTSRSGFSLHSNWFCCNSVHNSYTIAEETNRQIDLWFIKMQSAHQAVGSIFQASFVSVHSSEQWQL